MIVLARRYKKKGKEQDPYDYRDGYSYIPQKEGRQAKKKGSTITKVLIFVFLTVFLISGAMLVNELLIKPYFNDKSMNQIQDELESDLSSAKEEEVEITRPDGKKETVKINDTVRAVNKLKEKYPDIMGWVKVPGTEIHFPVVQSGIDDPEYYLYRNYRGEDTEYGSIFLDAGGSINSFNQILHGHSMLDQRMFYCLIDFDKLEVYKKSPVINYDTYQEAGKWKIVSVYKTNTYSSQGEPFKFLTSDFSTKEEEMQYIYDIMNRSIIDTGVDIKSTDRFISLSTCSYELEGFRTVVVARKLRPGESEEVDTSKAKLRSDALYPQGWYDTFGGTMPRYPETFQEAKDQGITTWYVE